MIITIPWLKEHLKTSAKENEIIDSLTNIGLEVEGVKENSREMGKFKIAKVLKAEKHPNADKLKVCDVTIGGKEILKVVCGAPNAREGLITIYAPPGAIIPKTNFELKVSNIFFLNFFLSSAFEIAFEFAPINSILYFLRIPFFSASIARFRAV